VNKDRALIKRMEVGEGVEANRFYQIFPFILSSYGISVFKFTLLLCYMLMDFIDIVLEFVNINGFFF
jgi:hypothetical protein